MAHQHSRGRYHPSRISGEQKRVMERAVNSEIVVKDGSIRECDLIKIPARKYSKRRKH